MKHKKLLKQVFKLIALLLFAGLASSIYIKEGGWEISIGIGLIYEAKKLE
ncbi:MAG: hypothetical protein H6937_02575 [Burkholderiales bacterium]|nr:hypothetical protein [Burkholderiales bacterium]